MDSTCHRDERLHFDEVFGGTYHVEEFLEFVSLFQAPSSPFSDSVDAQFSRFAASKSCVTYWTVGSCFTDFRSALFALSFSFSVALRECVLEER